MATGPTNECAPIARLKKTVFLPDVSKGYRTMIEVKVLDCSARPGLSHFNGVEWNKVVATPKLGIHESKLEHPMIRVLEQEVVLTFKKNSQMSSSTSNKAAW